MATPGKWKTLFAVVLWALALSPAAGRRKKPPPPLPAVVQALKPTGLRISVLDEEGMDLVIINANINIPLEEKEEGKITQTILRAQDGFWTMEDTSQQLKPNDIVFYWVYSSSIEGRRNYVGHHSIGELVDPSCKPSVTTVNGQPACKGALVFEDNFDTFNKTAWKHKIEFPENLFNTFVPDEENTFTKDGILHLKATVMKDPVKLSEPWKLEGCTSEKGGDFCEQKPFAWKIVPPTKAPWIYSTSSFKFGRFEMRAKVAAGDYLVSKFLLLPLVDKYPPGGLVSGLLLVTEIRGNEDLVNVHGQSYGANQLLVRAGLSSCHQVFFWYQQEYVPEGLYTDKFRTYSLTWTTRELKYEVDGKVAMTLTPPQPDGFASMHPYQDCDTYWEKGTFMAPFDHEAPLDFWRARDDWMPTWKGDFEIDYIKIWAL